MKKVRFEDENYNPRKRKLSIINHDESELVSWVLEKGWLKNKNAVASIFVVISLIFIFLSVLFFTEGKVFSSSFQPNQPYYIDIPTQEEPILVHPNENLSEVLDRYNK
jgi:predicted PurR-regulated permease PerM